MTEMSRFDQGASFQISEKPSDNCYKGTPTRGSAITPGVSVWMTLCTNLIQHTRTPAAAVSHRRSMFDLIAAIFSQVGVSSGLLILDNGGQVRDCFPKHDMKPNEALEGDTLHILPIQNLRVGYRVSTRTYA